jgi:hypothetical protein
MVDPQDAALLLGRMRKIGYRQQRQYGGGKRLHAPHVPLPRWFGLIRANYLKRYHDGAAAQPARAGVNIGTSD